MKKQNIKKLVASAVLTIGLISPMAVTNQSGSSLFGTTNIVQAATRKITLTHNAYIYNYRGRRVGRRVFHKYTTHTYFSVRKIHGKRYYRIGHNRYVKAGNARTISSDSKRTITPASINTSSLGSPIFKIHMLYDDTNDVYKNSSDSSWFGNKYFKEGDYNVYAYKNGKYEIGQNLWVLNTAGEKINGSNNTNNVSSTSSDNSTPSDSKPSINPSATHEHNNYQVNEQNIAKIFVNMVNQARAEKGIAPLTIDDSLMSAAHVRSIHDGNTLVKTGQEDDHRDDNGNIAMPDFAQAEVETGLTVHRSDEAVAKEAYDSFMLNDADCNWGHRDILLDSNLTKIGVGVTYPRGNDSNYFGSLVADLN